MDTKAAMTAKLYRQIEVWRRISDDTLVCYRCFELIPDARYCVQSADFVRVPPDHKLMEALKRNWLELLAETAPDERGKTFGTLEEAIANHDAEFGKKL